MSYKDNIDNNCLHEIKQQLAHLTGMFEQFLSGVKGPAPMLSGPPDLMSSRASIKAPKFPLPQGATFTDIIARMVDYYVLISVKGKGGKPQRINFVELDCNDKRKKGRLIPDSHWRLLQRLAEHDGILTWQKSGFKGVSKQDAYNTFEDGFQLEHTDCYTGKDMTRIKNLVYGLRKKLQAFFGLSDDPFYRYDEVHCYKTKFDISKYDPTYFGPKSERDEEDENENKE